MAVALTPVATTTTRKGKVRRWHVVAGAGVAITLAILYVWPRMAATPPPEVISASGRIEGRDVTLAPKNIQARVRRLLVDEGDTVRKGQLVAELDAAQLDARYATLSAQAASLDAQITEALLDVDYTAKNSAASVAAAEAAVSGAQARVERARAVLQNASIEHQRASELFAQGAVAKRALDQAEMALQTGEADLDAAEKELARTEANLALAHASADTIALKRQRVRALQASRRSATGQIAEAQANLEERQIAAPTDGTILSRPVEVGDVVSPGSPIFQMTDMSRLYVKVYVPEPDIGKLKLGDRAEVFVDAFPNRSFPARVSKIHDEAEFTPKNVETADERLKLVFGVELAFDSPDGVLKPGMPADCVIHWEPPGEGEARRGSR